MSATFEWPLVSSINNPPANIKYVCSLCFRQYDLVEDLRGHMIVYHKYKPKRIATSMGTGLMREVSLKSAAYGEATKVGEPNMPTVTSEMRPLPFRDFRLLLRSKLNLKCDFKSSCPYKFETDRSKYLHMNCHSGVENTPFKCCECGLDMRTWRRCSSHLWQTHQINVDLLHCPICDYIAHASVLVWRHMRVHQTWRARVVRSLRSVQIRRQRRQTADEKKRQHTIDKNKYYSEKICDICQRKFVNGKTLSKHVKAVHKKIKPFMCNVCGKKTARKASLTIHMRQHTGEKPLECRSCQFSTRDPSALQKHQQRHEKHMGKLKCKLCTYNCIQTAAFKRHMRVNHPDAYKKMACDICGYSTISEEKLLQHKNDHKNGLVVRKEDSMDAMGTARTAKGKSYELSADCFLPLESIDSMPHEPPVDTGGVTIPAPSEDTQFATFFES